MGFHFSQFLEPFCALFFMHPVSLSMPPFQSGFTITEALVVMAIVAVLSAIAIPSFKSSTQTIRTTTEASLLTGAFTYARSEALKRGSPVSVCPSIDGATCASTTNWQSGWIVFSDPTGKLAIESVLKVQRALSGSDTVTVSSSPSAVIFNRDGFATGLPSTIVTYRVHTTPSATQAVRCVALSKTGRIASQVAGVGACT